MEIGNSLTAGALLGPAVWGHHLSSFAEHRQGSPLVQNTVRHCTVPTKYSGAPVQSLASTAPSHFLPGCPSILHGE